MSVDEGRRLLLHDAAREAWGPDAALVLMEMLPPTGWGDVATRQQLEALEIATRQQLEAVEERLDLRIDTLEERLDKKIHGVEARFEAKLEHGLDGIRSDLRTQIAEGQTRMIQWTVATMIALVAVMTGVVTAIVQLG